MPSIRAAFSSGGVRVLGADDDVAPRSSCRAAISAASVDVEAVSSMWPCQPAGQPEQLRDPVADEQPSSSVEAGDVRQRNADLVQRRREQLGEDPRLGAGAAK